MVNKQRVLIYLPILLFAILSFIMIGKNDKVLKDILAWRKQFRINGTNRFFGFLFFMVNFRDIRNLLTIGYRNFLATTFGDDIQISPGAKIIGGISIGSNSKIGPNALVMDNIPPGSIVITQKGIIIK